MSNKYKKSSSPVVSSESKTSYPHPLLTMWRVVLSLPLAMVWMIAFFLVMTGRGLKAADGMLVAWNKWASNWE